MNYIELDQTKEYFIDTNPVGKIDFQQTTPKEIRQKYGYLKWDYLPDTMRGLINEKNPIDMHSCSVYKSVKENESLPREIRSLFMDWRLGIWKSFRNTGIRLLDSSESVTLTETNNRISIQVNDSMELFLSKDGSFGYVTRDFITERHQVYSFSTLNDLYTILSNFSDYVLNGTEFNWITNPESSELFDFRY